MRSISSSDSLPTALCYARQLATQSKISEANTTQFKLAHKAARATATAAPIPEADFEFQLLALARDFR